MSYYPIHHLATKTHTAETIHAAHPNTTAIMDGDLYAVGAETEVKAIAARIADSLPATPRGTITDKQVTYILSLLGNRDEGGFYNGPTTLAGIQAMSRQDASLYIDSLSGNY